MGLAGAGERSQRKPFFPNLMRKHVFDLGCGYGWQCKFAAEQGVMCVLGIDRSTKMIAEAQRRNADVRIEYRVCRIEKYEYRAEEWDCVISNLAPHASLISMQFIKSASDTETRRYLSIYIKHPTFTAVVRQEWVYAQGETPLCWPVDDDYLFSERVTNFFGYEVRKQHHTLQQILMGLLNNGFELLAVEEAQPPEEMMEIPGMKDELRRPMMLLVKAKKKA